MTSLQPTPQSTPLESLECCVMSKCAGKMCEVIHIPLAQGSFYCGRRWCVTPVLGSGMFLSMEDLSVCTSKEMAGRGLLGTRLPFPGLPDDEMIHLCRHWSDDLVLLWMVFSSCASSGEVWWRGGCGNAGVSTCRAPRTCEQRLQSSESLNTLAGFSECSGSCRLPEVHFRSTRLLRWLNW